MQQIGRVTYMGAVALTWMMTSAQAEPIHIVPGIEFAQKSTDFDFSVQGQGSSQHAYTTMGLSLGVGMGAYFVLFNHDITLNNSRVTQAGNTVEPILSMREYERAEDSLNIGYRIDQNWSGFIGMLRGRSDFFALSHDVSNPSNTVTGVSHFTFNETGYFVGGSFSYGIRSGNLSTSLAAGIMDGKLNLREASGPSVFESSAPGYSISVVWSEPMSPSISYRIGLKRTAYIFDIDKVTVSGINVSTSSLSDPYFEENIVHVFVGLAARF